MRLIIMFMAIIGLIVLTGCTGGPMSGESSAKKLAQDLANRIVQFLNDPNFEPIDPSASPVEFMNLVTSVIYIPQNDRNDSDVFELAKDLIEFIAVHFTMPTTVTSVDVLSATEYSVKQGNFFTHVLDNPPDFVMDVYMLNLECENQDGQSVVLFFPMITVTGQSQGFFYTIYITGSSTEVRMYPLSWYFD